MKMLNQFNLCNQEMSTMDVGFVVEHTGLWGKHWIHGSVVSGQWPVSRDQISDVRGQESVANSQRAVKNEASQPE
jgi:hypothetical protein